MFLIQHNCDYHLTPMCLSIPVLLLLSQFRGEVPGFAAQEHVCVTCALCCERSVAATYFSTPSKRNSDVFTVRGNPDLSSWYSSQAEYHETWILMTAMSERLPASQLSCTSPFPLAPHPQLCCEDQHGETKQRISLKLSCFSFARSFSSDQFSNPFFGGGKKWGKNHTSRQWKASRQWKYTLCDWWIRNLLLVFKTGYQGWGKCITSVLPQS